jgi:hypothetical protein
LKGTVVLGSKYYARDSSPRWGFGMTSNKKWNDDV